MYTVMTVCTGNICRSPMAEIILRTEFERRGLATRSMSNPAASAMKNTAIRSIVAPSRCCVSVDMSFRRTISRTASLVMRSSVPTCSCR